MNIEEGVAVRSEWEDDRMRWDEGIGIVVAAVVVVVVVVSAEAVTCRASRPNIETTQHNTLEQRST